MIIFKHSKDLEEWLNKSRSSGLAIGFVPTMGALHNGHLSLIRQSKEQAQITVCSIFVNRIQFNNPEDYNKYPVTIDADVKMLVDNKCDVLFLPEENEIYPDGQQKYKKYDLGYLETVLEGKFRPGHFQGVCNVMEKLLRIISPDYLFMGQKDFQQCLVIDRLKDLLQLQTTVVVSPIFREPSGLAMSSRNMRLTTEEKLLASNLYQSLEEIKNNLPNSGFEVLKTNAISKLEELGFKIDYLELANAGNLQLESEYSLNQKQVLLLAAFLNNVRLIDNVLIN
jgi:pantoate--beta-alanine ligase